jgi:quercetin dioxygenase-like cupin family protein
MKVTFFTLDGDDVRTHVTDTPPWEPLEEWEGEPLKGVELVRLQEVPRAEIQQVMIRAGGHFVMHTSPDLAWCQIVRGRGVLALPDGTELPYEGPELYVFEPGTLHEWKDISADTLLTTVLIRRPSDA